MSRGQGSGIGDQGDQNARVEITCEIWQLRDLAVRIFAAAPGGDRHVWLPRSQIEIDDSRGSDRATITLPEWLALEKGLI